MDGEADHLALHVRVRHGVARARAHHPGRDADDPRDFCRGQLPLLDELHVVGRAGERRPFDVAGHDGDPVRVPGARVAFLRLLREAHDGLGVRAGRELDDPARTRPIAREGLRELAEARGEAYCELALFDRGEADEAVGREGANVDDVVSAVDGALAGRPPYRVARLAGDELDLDAVRREQCAPPCRNILLSGSRADTRRRPTPGVDGCRRLFYDSSSRLVERRDRRVEGRSR